MIIYGLKNSLLLYYILIKLLIYKYSPSSPLRENFVEELYQKLTEKCPFLTIGQYMDNEICGIVQNCDNQFISIYSYDAIHDENMKKLFLKYGEIWWWESNHQIPINVFLGEQFKMFKPYLKSFVKKDFQVLAGPVVSLSDVITKRIKKRQIQLIKKIPSSYDC